jgi:hypothetical protein
MTMYDQDAADFQEQAWEYKRRAHKAEAEVERLHAKLDMPCGSCHPCTQWANQTWINAGERLPHVIDWQDMRGERDAALAKLDAVSELHRSWGIYDACDHEHELNDDGGIPEGVYDIDDVGLTCKDAFMYEICYHCCTSDSGYQTEECLNHLHGADKPRCATIAILDAPTEAGT